ncbi:zinc finger CCCH-type antiviral protein 1-like [Petromyzon marinus]|uniref:zinc finger CCCH-type antiviral protein 1-like n=1 Tax=Petromyzon marinus TaxID=7757 RepID=UPI003F729831
MSSGGGKPFERALSILHDNGSEMHPLALDMQLVQLLQVPGSTRLPRRGQLCQKLHMCRSYVLGSMCRSYVLGSMCRSYVLGSMCRSYVLGNCKFGPRWAEEEETEVEEDLNPRAIWLVRYRSAWMISKLVQQLAVTKASNLEEICLYHLLSECQFKERCLKSHAKLPYRQQKRDKLARIWEDTPDMETIAQRYCDPINVSWNSVDLVRMTMDNNAVRRLSTANGVTKPDNFLLTTKRIWYWQEDVGKWITYGSQATTNEKAKSEVSSGNLEKAYEKDKKGGLSIFAGRFSYHVSFKEMIQTNMTLGTRRDVRRRPLFVPRRDVEAAREGYTL